MYRSISSKRCNKCHAETKDFFPFVSYKFSNYDCQLFFEKLVDKKIDKIKNDILPKTKEEYVSLTYGCIRFIDS